MSSEKKHHWLVAYITYNEYGGSVYGHVTLRTSSNYFNTDSMKEAQQHISKGSAFLSVSYLGEMTEEEWKGEE